MSVKSKRKAERLQSIPANAGHDEARESMRVIKNAWLRCITDMKYEFDNTLNDFGETITPSVDSALSYDFILDSLVFAFGIDRLKDLRNSINALVDFLEEKDPSSSIKEGSLGHVNSIRIGLTTLKLAIESFEEFKPTLDELIARTEALSIQPVSEDNPID